MTITLPNSLVFPRVRVIVDGEEKGADPREAMTITYDAFNDEYIIDIRTADAPYHRLEAAWHGR